MNKSKSLFIFLFLLVIFIPVFFFNYKEDYSYREKRSLAAFPNFFINEKINSKIFKGIDNYIGDRIGAKNIFVSMNAELVYSLLKKSGNDSVVLGKDGWLFYIKREDGDNFSDFFKTNLFNEEEIAILTRQISARKEWCEQNGIKFVMLICPNKHNIYPEYYPIGRPEGETRTEALLRNLPREMRDYIIYPKDLLLSRKDGDPLYYENDTHWNSLGASYVFDLLFQKISSYFPDADFPQFEYTITRSGYDGDLPPMLGIGSNKFKGTSFIMEPASKWETFYSYTTNVINDDGTADITTKGTNDQLPKALILRDSFHVALEPFTSSLFSRAEYRWKIFNESDKEAVLETMPDVVIWEMVERNLYLVVNSEWN
jgi:hypothetical protein